MNKPMIIDHARRIVAMGDIHGDYKLAIKLLKIAKVIDDDIDWIGRDTIVVQVGDQIDRCRPLSTQNCADQSTTLNDSGDDIKVLQLFTFLHDKAKKQGGAVYSLVGNHELMNVLGDLSYVSYQGLKEFDTGDNRIESWIEARKNDFRPGGKYAKLLAETRQSVIIIGNNLFAHAGVLSDTMQDRQDIIEINNAVRKWLLDKHSSAASLYVDIDHSVFWNRILGSIPPNMNMDHPDCHKYLKKSLKVLKIDRMIIGHTPQFSNNQAGINSTCSGSLWRIDSGSSAAFDKFDDLLAYKIALRRPQVLEILNEGGAERINILA